MDVFALLGQFVVDLENLLDVELLDVVALGFADIVNEVTSVTADDVHGLNAEDMVGGTFWGAA